MQKHPSIFSSELYHYERLLRKKGFLRIAGIDEAGRGPLAGPVVAAACILPEDLNIEGIFDSKQVSAKKRAEIFSQLKEHPSVEYAVSIIDAEVIDRINILQATLLAMKEATMRLAIAPDALLIDGNQFPKLEIHSLAIPKGDSLSLSIAAASIIAKETRDALMEKYHEMWPEYGFRQHKGYGTKSHREKICEYGPCPIHRTTFEPIRSYLLSR